MKPNRADRIAAIALVAMVGAWALSDLRGPQADARNAGPAPQIGIQTPDGTKSTADYRGQVLLVDFWATWCAPCRASIPGIERLYEKYRTQGFQVLGVSMDDTAASIPTFAGQMGITYPVGLAVAREAAGRITGGGIPFLMLVDRKGNVRWRQGGYAALTEGALEAQIRKLLAEH